MIVEFCSPPGSGKSTVFDAVLDLVNPREAKYHLAREMRKLDAKALQLKKSLTARIPLFARQTKQYCNSHCFYDVDRYLKTLLRDIYYVSHWRKHAGQRPVLFDEAIAQRFLSLCMRSRRAPEALLPSYRELTPRLDAIVSLTVPSELALARMRSRDRGPPPFMSRMSDEEILRLVNICNEAQDVLIDRVERDGTVVIRCDGRDAPGISAAKVAAFLSQHTPGGGAQAH
jgi:hypothetical protein